MDHKAGSLWVESPLTRVQFGEVLQKYTNISETGTYHLNISAAEINGVCEKGCGLF